MYVSSMRVAWLIGVAFVLMLLPRSVSAQSTIAGLVTDTSGAVLPGVSVEASSPALIEKVRTAVTNSDGRYSIVDLRPGTYTITFTLQGFTTLRRDGIEVSANVTVPVNAELKVGALQETVTVSGVATPVVDIQQAAQRQVLSRDTLDALPSARSYLSAGVIVPAVKTSRSDLGGVNTGQGAYLSARGKSALEDIVQIDGLDFGNSNGTSQSGYNNFAMVQDVTYQTSAIGADASGGGVRINMIPRDGGNAFKGDFYLSGSRNAWQSSNITPELQAKGLPNPDSLNYVIEATPALGGPIFQNRLWYFASGRYLENSAHRAGAHYRDGSPAYTLNDLHNLSGRLTWQASTRNKFTGYIDKTFKSQKQSTVFTLGDVNPAGVDWETATVSYDPSNYQVGYFKWTSTATNKLLLEAGSSFNTFNLSYQTYLPGIRKPRGSPEWFAGAQRRDLVLNTFRGAPAVSELYAWQPSNQYSGSASYVTGSHTFKTGVQFRRQRIRNMADGGNADLVQQYRNGISDSVSVAAVPYIAAFHVHETALYAMDTWTLGRLTVSPGLRYEHFEGGVDPSGSAAGRFVPARQVSASSPVHPFNNLTPRLSAVYDLFGNARTALKFSASKYVAQLYTTFFYPYNPISQGNETRTWTDLNGDDIAQDNEIGPSQNARFGLAADRRVDPDISREYTWDYSVSLQHELLSGVSVSGGWYYTRNYNALRSVNAARSLSDYTTFQTPNPLTGEMLTIYNLNRSAVGRIDIVDTNSDINRRLYTGYEVSMQARRRGGTLLAGWAMERTRTVNCDTADNPNNLRFCDQTGELYQELGQVGNIPYRHEFKLAGSQQLPWGFLAAVSFFSYAGSNLNPLGLTSIGTPVLPGWAGPLNVLWTVPANLFPGGRNEVVTVPLIPPGSQYLKRWNQLDLNIKRVFHLRRLEFQPAVEIYNVLNSSVVLAQNQNFGPALGTPSLTPFGRFVKLGALVKF
ncbi:MAG TPA: TonB-dependent receptor [Vicinamibacterales bacterium]|jgi:hypothetical protein|nr:TonB-dependent receptor [Vicinamibacterales bacterium]